MTPHTNVHTLVFDRLADPADNLLLIYVVNPWAGDSHQPSAMQPTSVIGSVFGSIIRTEYGITFRNSDAVSPAISMTPLPLSAS